MEIKTQKKLDMFDGGYAYLLMIALYLLLSLIVPLILSTFLDANSTLFTLLTATLSIISMLVVVLGYKKKSKLSLIKIVNISKFNGFWIVVSLLLALGMFLGLGFINIGVATVLRKLSFSTSSVQINMDNFWIFLAYVLVLAIMPATIEEFFFRGLLVESLKGVKTISVLVAVNLSFALYHCSFVQLIYQFIYGIFLTKLAIKSGSVLPSIIAHFANNVVVLILTYLEININFFSWWIILIGLVLLSTAVYFIFFYKESKSEYTQSVKSFYLPYGILAMLVCLCLATGGLFV